MILIGKNVSPFERRVTVGPLELELPFEQQAPSPSSDANEFHSPWQKAFRARAGDGSIQADVTTACGSTFLLRFDEGIVSADRHPWHRHHRDLYRARPAFQMTHPVL